MRVTIDLPDAMLRRAMAISARQGIPFEEFLTAALEEQIQRYTEETQADEAEAPWMAGFGALSDLSDENRRILKLINEEFETLDS